MKPRIDAQRWSEVRTLFDQLVDLDPNEQSERLASIDASDSELRRALTELLAADADAGVELANIDRVFTAGTIDDDDVRHGADPLGLAGRTVSHFQIGEPLAAGGMGVVYRAEDLNLRRAIALKFPLPSHYLDRSAKERFLQEARSAGALDHPNICGIYETGETDDGHLFLAMPLYDGETLRARLARDGALAVAHAISIARQITDGICAAHKAGIVHRDLKPANVMLLPDGTVKLLDFGLAKVRDLTLTASRARVGTVSYMAPEQILGQPVDGRVDLWAVGVILYEMLTGRRPFDGEYDVSVAHAIVNAEPARPAASRAEIGSDLDDVIWRLMRKTPAERHASASQLATELAAIASGFAAPPHQSQASAFGRRRSWAAVATVALAVTVLVTAVLGAWLVKPRADSANADAARTVAVLPFTDLSDNHEGSYLAVGLSDAIAVELSRLRALIVPSYGSTSSYSAAATPLAQIATELSAAFVVRGSFRRAADRITVNAELIDVTSNERLWSRRYDRAATQALDIPRDAVNAIVAALRLDLTDSERALLERRPTGNARAYDLYLRGRNTELRASQIRGTNEVVESLAVAQSYYSRARELDPAFAMARARLALAYAFTASYHDHSQARLDQARLEAETALRLQPGLPEAHEALAYQWGPGRGEFTKAAEELRLAIRGFPNNAEYHLSLGDTYRRQGQWEEAVAELERAMQLEPRSAAPAANLAMTYSRLRRYDQAIRAWDRALALAPNDAMQKVIRGYVFVRWLGTVDTLAAALRSIPASSDPNGMMTFARVQVARVQRRYHDALAVLDSSQHTVSFDGLLYRPHSLLRAQVYEAMGERERARRDYEAARTLLSDSLAARPNDPRMRTALGLAYAGLGRKQDAIAEARGALALVSLAQDSPGATAVMGEAVVVFAQAGETNRALELLELLFSIPAGREVSVPLLRVDPAYDPLREDPRFAQLLARFSTE